MTERRPFILRNEAIRQRAIEYVREVPLGFRVDVKPAGRTLDQNAAQWPYLEAFSKQLKWPVNGELAYIDPEDWKDIMTAAFHNESMRVAQGLDGHPVMLGQRTSKFSKAQFSEYIEFLKATAAERSVTVYDEDEPT